MAKADDYIDRIVEILAKEGNTQKSRLLVTAFISTLLANWAYNTHAHRIDTLGILEMAKETIHEWEG